ncbi:MAG TPA: TolC family protein, partial [Terriglobia bacterium]|nr:TolC family protein [Terriglobia bacterium]
MAGFVPRHVRLSSPQKQETVCRTNSFLALVFLLLVQATAVSGWSQQISSVSDEVLTLDQAIALALYENPSVREAELEAGKSEDRLAAARTNRYPSMYVFSVAAEQFLKPDVNTADTQNIFPAVGPFFSIPITRSPTFTFTGLVTQPLSQQYNLALNIKQAKVAQD